jgi:hypothetical protein
MSIPCTGVIATDADLQCKERQDRYVRLNSGDVALHPRENAELDAAILQRETCRRVVGITAADLDAMDFPPINWIVPDILPEGLTILAGAAVGRARRDPWRTEDAAGPMTPAAIVAATEMKRANVDFLLHKMGAAGEVLKVKRGLYTSATNPKKAKIDGET